MTAQPHDFVTGNEPDPATRLRLRAIRAALVVRQDREAFDTGLTAVLDEGRVDLDLGLFNAFMHRWSIAACDSTEAPQATGECTSARSRFRR